jgi:hypothetical protein
LGGFRFRLGVRGCLYCIFGGVGLLVRDWFVVKLKYHLLIGLILHCGMLLEYIIYKKIILAIINNLGYVEIVNNFEVQ